MLGLTDTTGMRDRIRVAANSDPRGNERDDQDRADHCEAHIGRDVGDRRVDAMGEGENQLDADEDEDDREPKGQVDELVEKPLEQEVKSPESEQCEGIGGEDDVGLRGHTEGRRNRVEGEEQVGRTDSDHHQEQGCGHALAVDLHERLGAVVLLGERVLLADPANDEVIRRLGVLVAVAGELNTRVDEQGAEEHEGEAEGLERSGADGDKNRSEDEREDYTHEQDPLVKIYRHSELRQDDDEDEEVVDGKRLLD